VARRQVNAAGRAWCPFQRYRTLPPTRSEERWILSFDTTIIERSSKLVKERLIFSPNRATWTLCPRLMAESRHLQRFGALLALATKDLELRHSKSSPPEHRLPGSHLVYSKVFHESASATSPNRLLTLVEHTTDCRLLLAGNQVAVASDHFVRSVSRPFIDDSLAPRTEPIYELWRESANS